MRITASLIGLTLCSMLISGCGATTGKASEITGNPGDTKVAEEIVVRAEAPPIVISTEPSIQVPEISDDYPVDLESDVDSPIPGSEVLPNASDAADTLLLLDEIAVKGRASKTGYSRDLFGRGWGDPDRNGCDARNDILQRDLEVHEYKPGTHDCVVLSGTLVDPFTGTIIEFQRGQGTSNAVQIDHLVALSDAWQKGAQQLSPERRVEFSNDPLNLLAVDGPSNASKGDGDAATWLPPNRSYWCEYVTRQIQIKHEYGLWMTSAEHTRSKEIVIDKCS